MSRFVKRIDIKSNQIDNERIDFGTSGTQVNAASLPIINMEGIIDATNTNDAILEIASKNIGIWNQVDYVSVSGYYVDVTDYITNIIPKVSMEDGIGTFVDAIGNYNNGLDLPSSTTNVIKYGKPGYCKIIDSTTKDVINDANGHEIYGVMFYDLDTGKFFLCFYSDVEITVDTITPQMVTNTTPSPFVVTGSKSPILGTDYYNFFDQYTDNFNVVCYSGTSGDIQIYTEDLYTVERYNLAGLGIYPNSTYEVTNETVLLLECNGTNNSTTFTDSAAGKTASVVGDSKISTSQYKFGGSSAYFDGTGDYLTFSSNDDFKFTAGTDFTVDLWYRPVTQTNNYERIFELGDGWNATDLMIIDRHPDAPTKLSVLSVDLNMSVIVSTTSINNNQWYHIALTRNGSNLYLFINGNLEGTALYNYDINTTTKTFCVAGNTLGRCCNCYIDMVRVVKGTALWTSSFIVLPDAAGFTDIALKDWTLETSENGTDWTVADTQTNQTDWTENESRSFELSSPVTANYFKIACTDNNGNSNYTTFGELDLIGYTYVPALSNLRQIKVNIPTSQNINFTYTEVFNFNKMPADALCRSGFVGFMDSINVINLIDDNAGLIDYLNKIQINLENGGILEFDTDGSIKCKQSGITSEYISFGLSANMVSASALPIEDVNNYFISNNVEGALNELAPLVLPLRNEEYTINNTDISNGYIIFTCKINGSAGEKKQCNITLSGCGELCYGTDYTLMNNDANEHAVLIFNTSCTVPGITTVVHPSAGINVLMNNDKINLIYQ